MTADPRPTPVPEPDPNLDLGFGAVVARDLRKRLLNRDGTFNVRRTGLGFWQSLSAYHYFLTITWPRFLAFVGVAYVVTNAVFAALYVLAGAHALTGFRNDEPVPLRFVDAFFFSVHTLATIGYGNIVPANNAANLLVTVESLIGLLGFSIVAGIVFARFARPTAEIMFSDRALIAPYRDKSAFMFRIINHRSNQIVELEAKVLLARRKRGTTNVDREFIPLKLERDRVSFFPLAWTIVHPIDEFSPLRDATAHSLRECGAEFLVLLNGFDETFSQTVHTRSSYTGDEVVAGAKFRTMFETTDEGELAVDIRKLHEYDLILESAPSHAAQSA